MNTIFYGLEPKWFAGNRAYKIYEIDGNIVGIRVGGQFYNKTSVRTQLSPLYLTLIGIPIIEALAVWIDQRRKKTEDAAERDLIRVQELRDTKVLRLTEIDRIQLAIRRCWWTVGGNTGTVTVRNLNGDTWKLIVIGKQDMEKIGKVFQELGVRIERTTNQRVNLRGKTHA